MKKIDGRNFQSTWQAATNHYVNSPIWALNIIVNQIAMRPHERIRIVTFIL